MPSVPQTRKELEMRAEAALQGRDIRTALSLTKQIRDNEPNNPELWSEFLYKLHFADIPEGASFLEHRRYAERFEPRGRRTMRAHKPKQNGKIRIGYLSPDLYTQASHHVLLPILENHNRDLFEIYIYATHPAFDESTKEIQKNADAWRTAWHTDYAQIVQMIQKDEIDILVDLAGHTGVNSLPVFAERAAPVQVSWFGYMDTTGLLNMDYRLTDAWRVPQERTRFYTEELVYLSNSYTFAPTEHNETAPPSLTEPFLTFGSLNSTIKLTTQTLNLWADLLKTFTDSKLVVLACPDIEYAQGLKAFFGKKGVDPLRIEPRPRTSLQDFLEAVGDIDVSLDPFPYTGGVTTYHALSQGVPTITLEGTGEYARNCAAILKEAGLTDCIAKSRDEYIKKAMAIARGTERRSDMRVHLPRELRKRRGSIVPEVEEAFRKMHERIRSAL